MWTGIFAVVAAVCAVGWLGQYIGCLALAWYLEEKGYTPPTDEDLRACVVEVWKRILRIN